MCRVDAHPRSAGLKPQKRKDTRLLVSYNWLKDYVQVDASPEDLAKRLTMAGLEVASLVGVGEEFARIRVAKIEEIHPHPNADKLSICRIFDGTQTREIVCGARNMQAGDKVAFAPSGTALPNGMTIKAAKIRGVASEGMLCSEEELKLEEKSLGIMILPPEAEIGKDLASALGLSDYVFELELTPNRSDCLCMIGIAREVAALYDAPFALPSGSVEEEEDDVGKFVSVSLEAPECCPRYAARYLSHLEIRRSPLWLRRRLELAGIRAISNVVDVTNFILLEWGQPMHAFNYRLLDQGRIVVRKAAAGEKFFTLDGKERTLDEETLMICDASKQIAIGGIMGGLNTEVSEDTKAVLLESAYFDPRNIMRTSKKLGLRSESSFRFERGINPETTVLALNRAAQLMRELAGGKIARGAIDEYPVPLPAPPKIALRPRRTNLILGTQIPAKDMGTLLRRLGIETTAGDDETLHAQVPAHRDDLKEEIDLVEEVSRLHGFDLIPSTLPQPFIAEETGKRRFDQLSEVRALLADSGFLEVISYSFISMENIRALGLPEGHDLLQATAISNPLSQDQSVMRTSLIPGLLLTAAANHNRNNLNLKLFEIGRVFRGDGGTILPRETLMLGGLATGLRAGESWNAPAEEVDFYDLKGEVEGLFGRLLLRETRFIPATDAPYLHPGIAARILVGGTSVGLIGEVHPHVLDNFGISKKIFVFEIDFGEIINYSTQCERKVRSLPKFPPVFRDVALVLDAGAEHRAVEEAIWGAKVRYLEEVKVFDVYQGDQIPAGKKNLAYRMKFQAKDRSLTDEEVNRLFEKLLSHLTKNMEVELRR